ncbi:AsnC family transcriptional regulator [Candidatus Bathyarchaeota archaeon ex4484_205]|nr:MAG: AsnC family transcriptional regulator [Candidatus Bathyarchaeota archaeon ex4484_205]
MTQITFMLINVEPGMDEKILEELRKVENVKEAWFIYGVYDFIIKLEAETEEEIKETITEKIRRLEGVRNTLTLLPIKGFTKKSM